MQRRRGVVLTIVAVLFVILALSNFLKPLELNPEHGFIFFGRRLSGTANQIVAPLVGVFLLAYAVGIWRLRPWALTMGVAYAAYVVLNLALFTMRDPDPNHGGVAFNVIYAVVAISVSAGTAWLLSRRRADLG